MLDELVNTTWLIHAKTFKPENSSQTKIVTHNVWLNHLKEAKTLKLNSLSIKKLASNLNISYQNFSHKWKEEVNNFCEHDKIQKSRSV